MVIGTNISSQSGLIQSLIKMQDINNTDGYGFIGQLRRVR